MIVYLIRNLETLQNAYNYKKNNMSNEKEILSCTGEENAKKLSHLPILKELDAIYSSSYVSALSTCKYIAKENNKKINVLDEFNDRKQDISSDVDIIEYKYKTSHNFDYKIRNGESFNDVKKRTSSALKCILNENYDKVAIITHEFSIMSLLINFCELGYNYENEIILSYKDKVMCDTSIKTNEFFELEFDKTNLINIKKITF